MAPSKRFKLEMETKKAEIEEKIYLWVVKRKGCVCGSLFSFFLLAVKDLREGVDQGKWVKHLLGEEGLTREFIILFFMFFICCSSCLGHETVVVFVWRRKVKGET